MEPTISAEEFQRFQTQLLDLREELFRTKEQKLRAENRVDQLESERSSSKQQQRQEERSSNQSQLQDRLTRENWALKDKLQQTESSFQLQTSTLRAECHHLFTELTRLQTRLNRSVENQSCQTYHTDTPDASCSVERGVQTSTTDNMETNKFTLDSADTHDDLIDLRSALTVANHTQSVSNLAFKQLDARMNELEVLVHSELQTTVDRLRILENERETLHHQLSTNQTQLNTARESEAELKAELERVRTKAEKTKRELQRHLTRLVRNSRNNSQNQIISQHPSLLSHHQSNVYSSTSSLSSLPGASVNGRCTPDHDSLSHISCVPSEFGRSDENVGDELPSSDVYFPITDFKALVDRLSEVQEENCTLRRHHQRLQAELVQKNKALSMRLDHLLQPPISSPTASSGTRLQANGGSSFLSSALKSVTGGAQSKTHTLSLTNMETIHRLRNLCEHLLTQNIQLSDELQSIRQNK